MASDRVKAYNIENPDIPIEIITEDSFDSLKIKLRDHLKKQGIT